jgi:hypothetical protein
VDRSDPLDEASELELRAELKRLRAENADLRDRYRVDPPTPPAEADPEPTRPVRVLLLPDPLSEGVDRNRAKARTNVARVLVQALSERRPDVEWRAEHDLARIPEDAACHQLADAASRVMTGAGRLPPTYRVEHDGDENRLERVTVPGEPESESFLAGYNDQLQVVDDLLVEGGAAANAGAGHHAGWAALAIDVVLARLNLAQVAFRAGGHQWRQALAAPRPEYEPRGGPIEVAGPAAS